MRKRVQHRSLDYRRGDYRPGMGFCRCPECRREVEWRGEMGMDYTLGERYDGCTYVNMERVFAERWEEECQPSPGLNFGFGILQDLMVLQRHGMVNRVAFWITKRERVIVATVVQWLGTNCGFAFLVDVLRRCGYAVVPLDAPLTHRRTAPEAEAAPPPPVPPAPEFRRFAHLGHDGRRG